MAKERPKPPAQSKAELMAEVADLARRRYPTDPETALLYILNFFTAVDLVEIKNDLGRK